MNGRMLFNSVITFFYDAVAESIKEFGQLINLSLQFGSFVGVADTHTVS